MVPIAIKEEQLTCRISGLSCRCWWWTFMATKAKYLFPQRENIFEKSTIPHDVENFQLTQNT